VSDGVRQREAVGGRCRGEAPVGRGFRGPYRTTAHAVVPGGVGSYVAPVGHTAFRARLGACRALGARKRPQQVLDRTADRARAPQPLRYSDSLRRIQRQALDWNPNRWR